MPDTAESKRAKTSFGEAESVKTDLAGRSIRGGSSLVASEIGCNIFRLVGTIVLARLLTPEHFGLIGMVTALTAFAEMFKDLGLGTATIQRKQITHEQISSLFWVNTAVGISLMVILAVSAPLIAQFYHEPRLVWVALAISSTFLFGGLTIQHQALLRREMQFEKLALIQVASTGLSTLLGILLAWQGFEYWALVGKEVSRSIIQVSGTWLCSHWLPGLPVRGSGVRVMFQTGSHVTGFNILAFASRSLDGVLLGRFWGAGAVGLYKQAGQLLMIPVSLVSFPITYVMIPALSALQAEPERYRSYYKKVLSFMGFAYMPLIAYLAVYADVMIALLLGSKWMAATIIVQIVAIGAIIDPITGTCGTVMITYGRTKEYLRLGFVQSVFLTIAISIGINWGMIGVAVASATYTLMGLPFLVWYSFKDTPISPQLFYGALRLPAIATAIMTVILVGIRSVLGFSGVAAEFASSVVLGPLVYLSIWMVLPGGKHRLYEYYSYFRHAVSEVVSRFFVTNPSPAPVRDQA